MLEDALDAGFGQRLQAIERQAKPLRATGDLWTVWPKNHQVLYSKSDDGGVTWSLPAQLPTQTTNSIKSSGVDNDNDWAGVIGFGAGGANNIGIMWSDHDELPTLGDNGYYFSILGAGDDPTVEANWTKAKLPTTLSSGCTTREPKRQTTWPSGCGRSTPIS